MEPPANEGLLALVQLAMAAAGLLGHQAVDAMLAVLLLPAGLRRYAVAEGVADFFLRGQAGLPQRDRHQTQMDLVGQSHAVERFVPAEDDAVAVAIDEPHRAVEQGAAIGLGCLPGGSGNGSEACVFMPL